MRSFGAFVLLAGIGVGLFIYLPAPVDSDISLEKAQRFSKRQELSKVALPISAAFRLVSSQLKLADGESREALGPEEATSSTRKSSQTADVARASPPVLGTTLTGWRTNVTTTLGQTRSGSAFTSLKPKSPTDRYKLVVKIQRKLKKRRCYWGRIDGSWGAGSKYAMQAFVDRVNANLPVEDPDYVLLALLQTNSRKTCDGCPAGHITTDGGSCVPQTILAEEQRPSGSVGGNRAKVLSWRQTGTPQPLLRPVGTTTITVAPLSGRMAIGGPQPFPPPSAEDDPGGGGIAAVSIEDSSRTDISVSSTTRTPAAHRKRRAARREANRSRRRYRSVRAARRRNLMLSLGGAY